MTDNIDDKKEAPEVVEKPKTAQDYYASFIGKQAKHSSIFDSRDTKPISKDDIARSTGKK